MVGFCSVRRPEALADFLAASFDARIVDAVWEDSGSDTRSAFEMRPSISVWLLFSSDCDAYSG
jgi:hypothetical protein